MRWKSIGALALPFVIGAAVLRLAVAPAGDAIAGAVAKTAAAASARPVPPPPSAPSAPAENDLEPDVLDGEAALVPLGPSAPQAPGRLGRVASRGPTAHRASIDEARDAGMDAARTPAPPSLTDAPKATIVVPAAVVTRALEKRDVGATNATAPDGSALGARLAGVGRYRAGLRDGDVVISVGGTRTPTVAAMVSAGMAAAGNGATRISGRIVRGESVYAVVVELPK